jgi:hypothetical protein
MVLETSINAIIRILNSFSVNMLSNIVGARRERNEYW